MASRKKILKILKWLVLTLAVIFIAFIVLALIQAESYFNKNLSNFVNTKTGGLYQLEFNNIELQVLKKSFSISDIKLTHNIQLAKKLQEKNPNKIFYTFSTPELKVRHVNIRDFLLNKNILIDQIIIENPEFKLTGSDLIGNDSLQITQFAMEEAEQVFKKYINKIEVKEIEFINASYHFFNFFNDQSGVTKAEQVSVGISRFRTDSTYFKNQAYPFETDDIFVRIRGLNNEMSDSIHQLKIDLLEYSLKKAELKAYRTHLFPLEKTSDKSIYEVFIPEFNMKSQNLSAFNWNDSLDISYLDFVSPEIKFTPKENTKKIKIEDLNSFNLYELVKNDFSVINIDSFYLNNANLKIYKNINDSAYQQNYNDINIHLINFTLDSVSRLNRGKLLYADDIEMKVGSYELNMEDNLHLFTADSIYVSTFSDTISLSGIKLKPQKNLKVSTPVNIDIDCKHINITNIDLKKVYHERTIFGSGVEITDPHVSISNSRDFPKQKNQPGLLYDLVTDYLRGVYSNLIEINNGTINYRTLKNGMVSDSYQVEFEFILTDFALDSISQQQTDKLFYASDFELDFSNFEMILTDNLHRLNVKNIQISNNESRVQIDSLHLFPSIANAGEEDLKSFNRSQLYNIFIPKITLRNTDLHKAFFNNDIRISDFTIENPLISYENYANLKNDKNKLEFSELYDLIFNYIDNISISKLLVPSGTVKWINHSKKGKTITLDNQFSTELKNFRLNREETKKQKLLFSEQIRFTLNDQLFKLSDNVHYLKAGQINFSTEEKNVIISDALLYPDITTPEFLLKPTTFQVSIPELKLDGIDLVTAYYTKSIDVNKLSIYEPKVEIYSQKERTKKLDLKKFTIPFPAILNSLKIQNLQLENGEVVTYRSEGVNYSQSSRFKLDMDSEQISISPDRDKNFNKLESGNIITRVSDFQLVFEDKSHEARLDKMILNKNEKSLTLTNFALIPSRFGRPENLFNVTAPLVKLTGFDIENAYEFNDYSFDKIEFSSPDVKITLKDSIRKAGLQKFNNLDLYNYLEPYLNTLKIGNLKFSQASINVNSAKTNISQENINIDLKNIDIRENIKKQGLLNSDGFEFSTFNYNRKSKDGFYGFNIDTINYSSISKNAELRSVSIHPLVSKEQIASKKIYEVDVVNAKINRAQLNGFNFDRWLDEKVVEGKKLVIGKTELNIFRNKNYPFNTKQRPLWPQQLLYKIKQPFIVDSLILKPSTIIYSELLENGNEPVRIDFSDVSFKAGQISNMNNSGSQQLQINAKGKVLQKGLINLEVKFDPNKSDFEHHVKGSLSPVNMEIFNGIVEKSALVTIEKGQINRFDFDFTADDDKASGQLYFNYNDLKIAILDYKKGDTIKSRLGSFVANSFMVHSKNPRGKILEPQTIDYKRNPQRSILNYWWKSIYSGAKITLGLEKDKKK